MKQNFQTFELTLYSLYLLSYHICSTLGQQIIFMEIPQTCPRCDNG